MSENSERGVLYIATGKAFVDASNNSAESVKKYCPDLPVHIFTDEPTADDSHFDSVAPIANPHYRSKVDYLPRSPFQRTLYLDADTRVCADIREMFDLLDRFDIAFTHAHLRAWTYRQAWTRQLPYSFPQFNGGVILYKNSEPVIEFLEKWKTAFHETGFEKDQVTLRELIWKSDISVATLPPEYNIKRNIYLKIWTKEEAMPKILHSASFVAGKRGNIVRRVGRKIRKMMFRPQ